MAYRDTDTGYVPSTQRAEGAGASGDTRPWYIKLAGLLSDDDPRRFSSGNPLHLFMDVITLPGSATVGLAKEVGDMFQGEGFSVGDWWGELHTPTIGGGDLLADWGVWQGDSQAEKWGARLLGFGLDVGLDPLSYVSFGGAAVAGQGGRKALTMAASLPENRALAAVRTLNREMPGLRPQTDALLAKKIQADEIIAETFHADPLDKVAASRRAAAQQSQKEAVRDILKIAEDTGVDARHTKVREQFSMRGGGVTAPKDGDLLNDIYVPDQIYAKGKGMDGLSLRLNFLPTREIGSYGGIQIMSQKTLSTLATPMREIWGAATRLPRLRKHFGSDATQYVNSLLDPKQHPTLNWQAREAAIAKRARQQTRHDEVAVLGKEMIANRSKILAGAKKHGLSTRRLTQLIQTPAEELDAMDLVAGTREIVEDAREMFRRARAYIENEGGEIGDLGETYLPFIKIKDLEKIKTNKSSKSVTKLMHDITEVRNVGATYAGERIQIVEHWLAKGWAELADNKKLVINNPNKLNWDTFQRQVDEIAEARAALKGEKYVSPFETDFANISEGYIKAWELKMKFLKDEALLKEDGMFYTGTAKKMAQKAMRSVTKFERKQGQANKAASKFTKIKTQLTQESETLTTLADMVQAAKMTGQDIPFQVRSEMSRSANNMRLIASLGKKQAQDAGDKDLAKLFGSVLKAYDELMEQAGDDLVKVNKKSAALAKTLESISSSVVPDLGKVLDDITARVKVASTPHILTPMEGRTLLQQIDDYISNSGRMRLELAVGLSQVLDDVQLQDVIYQINANRVQTDQFLRKGEELAAALDFVEDHIPEADAIRTRLKRVRDDANDHIRILNGYIDQQNTRMRNSADYVPASEGEITEIPAVVSKEMEQVKAIQEMDEVLEVLEPAIRTQVTYFPEPKALPSDPDYKPKVRVPPKPAAAPDPTQPRGLDELVADPNVNLNQKQADDLRQLIKDETKVALRLDLNSLDVNGKKVGTGISVHPTGKRGAPQYGNTILHLPGEVMLKVDGAQVHVNRKGADNIKSGKKHKHPIASVVGTIEAVETPPNLLEMPNLTFNPRRENLHNQWLINNETPVRATPLPGTTPTLDEVPGGTIYTNGSKVWAENLDAPPPQTTPTPKAAVVSDSAPTPEPQAQEVAVPPPAERLLAGKPAKVPKNLFDNLKKHRENLNHENAQFSKYMKQYSDTGDEYYNRTATQMGEAAQRSLEGIKVLYGEVLNEYGAAGLLEFARTPILRGRKLADWAANERSTGGGLRYRVEPDALDVKDKKGNTRDWVANIHEDAPTGTQTRKAGLTGKYPRYPENPVKAQVRFVQELVNEIQGSTDVAEWDDVVLYINADLPRVAEGHTPESLLRQHPELAPMVALFEHAYPEFFRLWDEGADAADVFKVVDDAGDVMPDDEIIFVKRELQVAESELREAQVTGSGLGGGEWEALHTEKDKLAKQARKEMYEAQEADGRAGLSSNDVSPETKEAQRAVENKINAISAERRNYLAPYHQKVEGLREKVETLDAQRSADIKEFGEEQLLEQIKETMAGRADEAAPTSVDLPPVAGANNPAGAPKGRTGKAKGGRPIDLSPERQRKSWEHKSKDTAERYPLQGDTLEDNIRALAERQKHGRGAHKLSTPEAYAQAKKDVMAPIMELTEGRRPTQLDPKAGGRDAYLVRVINVKQWRNQAEVDAWINGEESAHVSGHLARLDEIKAEHVIDEDPVDYLVEFTLAHRAETTSTRSAGVFRDGVRTEEAPAVGARPDADASAREWEKWLAQQEGIDADLEAGFKREGARKTTGERRANLTDATADELSPDELRFNENRMEVDEADSAATAMGARNLNEEELASTGMGRQTQYESTTSTAQELTQDPNKLRKYYGKLLAGAPEDAFDGKSFREVAAQEDILSRAIISALDKANPEGTRRWINEEMTGAATTDLKLKPDLPSHTDIARETYKVYYQALRNWDGRNVNNIPKLLKDSELGSYALPKANVKNFTAVRSMSMKTLMRGRTLNQMVEEGDHLGVAKLAMKAIMDEEAAYDLLPRIDLPLTTAKKVAAPAPKKATPAPVKAKPPTEAEMPAQMGTPQRAADEIIDAGMGATLASETRDSLASLRDFVLWQKMRDEGAELKDVYKNLKSKRDRMAANLEEARTARVFEAREATAEKVPPINGKEAAEHLLSVIREGSEQRKAFNELLATDEVAALRHADDTAKVAYLMKRVPQRLEEINDEIAEKTQRLPVEWTESEEYFGLLQEQADLKYADGLLDEFAEIRKLRAELGEATPTIQETGLFAIEYATAAADALLTGQINRGNKQATKYSRAVDKKAKSYKRLEGRTKEQEALWDKFQREADTLAEVMEDNLKAKALVEGIQAEAGAAFRKWAHGDLYAQDHLATALELTHEFRHPSGLGKKLSTLISWWRGMALLSVGYHTRNATGGTLTNLAHGVTMKDHMDVTRALRKLWSGKGNKANMTKPVEAYVVNMLERRGLVGLGRTTGDVLDVSPDGRSWNPAAGMLDPNRQFHLVAANRRLGEGLEQILRLSAGWSVAKKMGKGRSQEAIAVASSQRIAQLHFDYRDLSYTERHRIRNVIPFWTWMSRNLPLTAKLMAHRPTAVIKSEALFSNISYGTPLNPFVPEYYSENNYKQITNDWFSTLEVPYLAAIRDADRLTSLPGEIAEHGVRGGTFRFAADANPWARSMVEAITGRDAFYGTQLNGSQGTARLAGSFLPFYPRLRRMIPGIPGQTERERNNFGASIASFFGVPVRKMSDWELAMNYARAKADYQELTGTGRGNRPKNPALAARMERREDRNQGRNLSSAKRALTIIGEQT